MLVVINYCPLGSGLRSLRVDVERRHMEFRVFDGGEGSNAVQNAIILCTSVKAFRYFAKNQLEWYLKGQAVSETLTCTNNPQLFQRWQGNRRCSGTRGPVKEGKKRTKKAVVHNLRSCLARTIVLEALRGTAGRLYGLWEKIRATKRIRDKPQRCSFTYRVRAVDHRSEEEFCREKIPEKACNGVKRLSVDQASKKEKEQSAIEDGPSAMAKRKAGGLG
ncbi:hypothetical protein WN48_05610 [Eufriesea mexicana]|uniref:Uncharacterized protein n=1 Tax=Eufriesea mexicana TaxID=516756 RepID=A0A310SL15_9HYME|nr:hypothetical protein WN48_05610 [Eufriesea mexicana]